MRGVISSTLCLPTLLCVTNSSGVIRIRISKRNSQHQRAKEKVQKNKKLSTKHTYKTKDRVVRTPLKPGSEFMSVQEDRKNYSRHIVKHFHDDVLNFYI
jgi:hypothetical protein